MIEDLVLQQIVCRPALPLDSPGMLELTSQIWEGDDYVPKVWQEWLSDTEGLLAIAELKGQVVGLGKLTKISHQDWWLEGLRVHPQYEGRRIASRIHKYLLGIWENIGSGKIRYATVSTREPVKHLARVNGFDLVGEFSTFKSDLGDDLSRDLDPFFPIESSEIKPVVNWLASKAEGWMPFGLMNLGWQFARPQEVSLANHIEEGEIWWWRKDRGLLILVEKKDGSNILGRIRQLVCHPDDVTDLLSDTHLLADRLGYTGITWLAPLVRGIGDIAAAAGFQRSWESSLLVFEKPAKKK